MPTAPLRFVFDPEGDELAAAKRCEADVFALAYGNTVEQFDVEYGPYEDSTRYMTVLGEDGEAVGTVRLILPGPAGLKTLNDVSREPWRVDGQRSARSAGIDPARTWDIATIAVRPGTGRGGLTAGSLYHGIINAAYVNDIEFIVMLMDAHARDLLISLGMPVHVLPGTGSGEYLGSPDSTPLWANIFRGLDVLRRDSPDTYKLIYRGIGLDGVALPTDWTLRSA